MKAKGQNTSSTTNCTDSIVKAIKQFTTVSNCYYIGNREKQMYIYKYMDIETAILCLKNNNIRFVEPTLWQDKYESRFYTADYSKIIKDKKILSRNYILVVLLLVKLAKPLGESILMINWDWPHVVCSLELINDYFEKN